MGRYIVKRLIEGVITLWLITLAVFFILRLGGGNPVEYMLPPEATQADIDKLTQAYGFDKPLIHQYWIFNKKLMRGDLGDALAWDKRPTIDVVWDRIPATLQLATRTVKTFESFLSTVIMSGNMAIFEMDDRNGETAFNLEYIPVYSRVMKRVVNRKPLGGGRSQ